MTWPRRLAAHQILDGAFLLFCEQHLFPRPSVDINMRELADCGRLIVVLSKDCEFISYRTVSKATQSNSNIYRFWEADGTQKLAFARDAEANGCLIGSSKDASFNSQRSQCGIEPAVVDRIINVAVRITIGPATGDLCPPQEISSSLFRRSRLRHCQIFLP